MSRIVTVFGLAALVVAGCANELTGPLRTGEWGGEGIAFNVSQAGVDIEFDCAHGSIEQSLQVRTGRFSAAGVLVREHGGPQREGEEPDMTPAVYEGEISGQTLRLTVRPEDRTDPIGPYLLRHGQAPQLRKCL